MRGFAVPNSFTTMNVFRIATAVREISFHTAVE